MWILILGLVVFFGIHSVRMVAGDYRAAQVASNERRWKGIYSLLSLLGVVLIVAGWWLWRADAPEIYEPPSWGRHVTMLLVLVAFILMASANMPAGRIKAWVQHPFLTGIFLWSLGHLLANGDLASVLTFGAFMIYAVVNRIAIAGRSVPPPQFVSGRYDIISIVSGVVLYAIFVFWLHAFLFGVSPLS